MSPAARLPLAAVLAAALAPIPGTAAELVDIAWDRDGRFETTLEVAPGRFVEVCGALARGQAIDWRFGSDAALDFNIHYHQGKQALYPTRRDGVARAEGRLEVEVPQDYCWMWTNPARAATRLRVTLHRLAPSGR